MNKEERYLEQLAARARQEPPPRVAVADQVMRTLRTQAAPRGFAPGPLGWIAAVSAVVAIPAALAGFAAWQALTNPVTATMLSVAREGLL